jgi:hypothetical protein
MSRNIIQHLYLSVPLPDGWEDASQVIALGPEQEGFRPNLVFSQEDTERGETPERFAARQLPQLRQVLNGYRVVHEAPARFGPNSGFLRKHTFQMDRGAIGQFQFYVLLGGRCYTFTFTHLSELLDEARPLAERLFAQARLTPQLGVEDDELWMEA